MSSSDTHHHSTSPTIALKIDALCDQFERDWREGRSPRIEDYLAGLGSDEAEVVIRELIRVEMQLRIEKGERPQMAEYQERFPHLTTQAIGVIAPDPDETVPVDTRDEFKGEPRSWSVGYSVEEGARFRVLRPHARGGLGAVFLALDVELNREVALKQILEHHADNVSSRQRFLIEAEITGGLEHPGIVPVYGLGTYRDGRPYYAMRFIRGDSLKQAIENFHEDPQHKSDPGARSLALRKLLRRLTDVCNAIDYAHMRGVIHRDIKPSNIILGRHGETLMVDWGLAKPLAGTDVRTDTDELRFVPSSSSGSAQTMPGMALGTPAFMSPEQAAGDAERVGVRSDVYSLGATLFAILTGQTPFDGDPRMIIDRLIKGDIPRPRQVDPSIDPALEAICVKAMAHDPGQRYPSARSLAEEIERWTADEPVEAWREPWFRRGWRWVRRHRTSASVAASLVLMAAISLGVGNLLLRDANKKINDQRAIAIKNYQQAEDHYQLARQSVDRYFTLVAEDRLLKEPGMDPLRKELLASAKEFYEELVQRRQGDPAAKLELVEARNRLSILYGELGDYTGSIAQLEPAIETLQELARDPASKERALQLLPTLLGNLGNDLIRVGQAEKGLARIDEGVRLAKLRVDEQPDNHSRILNLAILSRKQASSLVDQKRNANARVLLEKTRDSLARLVAAAPADTNALEELAGVCTTLGVLGFVADDLAASRASHTEALRHYRSLLQRGGTKVTPLAEISIGLNNLATLAKREGNLVEAEKFLLEAVDGIRKMVRDHPQIVRYRRTLGATLTNLSAVYYAKRAFVDADRVATEAIDVQERLAELHPELLELQLQLSSSEGNLANSLLARREFAKALQWFDRSIATGERILKKSPNFYLIQQVLRNSYWGRADTRVALGRGRESLADFETAARFADEKSRTEIRLNKAIIQARIGDHADALNVVDECTKGPATSRLTWFESARVLAQASDTVSRDNALAPGDRAARSVLLADRAINALKQSQAGGYLSTKGGGNRLRTDPDLNPIRNRPDFRLLMLDAAMPADPFTPARKP